MERTIVNFPYNSLGVARVDCDGIIHNHLYHNCPVGRIDTNNIIHSHPINNSPVGRVDLDRTIHNSLVNNSPIGRVNKQGYVYDNQNIAIGRVDGEDFLQSASAYLLLIKDLR